MIQLGLLSACGKLTQDPIPPRRRSVLPTELLNQSFLELHKKSETSLVSPSDSAGARTQDPILKRDVLYLLSY